MNFINWINENNGFLSFIISILVFIANIVSLWFTQRSLKLTRIIQKENVNIQLFNEKFDIYNKIMEIIDSKISDISSPEEIIFQLQRNSKKFLGNEAQIKHKMYLLFSDSSKVAFESLMDVYTELRSVSIDMKDLYEIYKEDIKEKTFLDEIEIFIQSDLNGTLTEEDYIKFEHLSNQFSAYMSEHTELGYKDYNFLQLYNQYYKLYKILNQKRKSFIQDLEKQLYI